MAEQAGLQGQSSSSSLQTDWLKTRDLMVEMKSEDRCLDNSLLVWDTIIFLFYPRLQVSI